MPTTPPTVSVILPVFNGERFLAQAIDSILAQTLPPTELIVVDDGSTDASAAIVARLAASTTLPIRYLRQPNRGPAAARNAGIAIAHGSFLAFQDADDLWLPDKQATQLALAMAHPEADIIAGLTQQIAEPQDYAQQRLPPPVPGQHHAYQLPNKLIRAACFARLGLLDESLRFGEDLEWLTRATQARAVIVRHEQVVVYHRRHKANMTLQLGPPETHLLSAMRRVLARHHAKPPPKP